MTNTLVGKPQEKRSRHRLTCQNITTTDVFKFQPVFCREVLKGDRFNIKTAQINRVDALPVSSFVEINNRHDWFYVKMNQIWKPFDNFISSTPYAFDYLNTVPSSAPNFALSELLGLVLGKFRLGSTDFALVTIDSDYTGSATNSLLLNAHQGLKDHNIDYVTVGLRSRIDPTFDSTTDTDELYIKSYVLNPIGRFFVSQLYSLGYRIPQYLVDSTDLDSTTISNITTWFNAPNITDLSNVKCSALPLMAYLSIIVNYYVPTKFRDYSFINSLSYLSNPIWHPTIFTLAYYMDNSNASTLRSNILKILLSQFYGSDYFTDSLQQIFASGPVSGFDPSTTAEYKGQSSDNTYYPFTTSLNDTKEPIVQTGGPIANSKYIALTQYILASLSANTSKAQMRALTKNNVLGSMLQQFGIKPESADMIPYLLSTHRDSIVIEPEISTAATSLAPLGYKAGSGRGSAVFDDHFEFDNYGLLICVNSISPEYMLSDGLHREMNHTSRYDYFDPQYANLGYQAVANFELTISPDTIGSSDGFGLRKVFGFQNKFAEYGYKKDSVGGDFVINSVNNGLDNFHFIRKFDGLNPVYLQNNEIFAQGKYPRLLAGIAQFSSQYDRIFDVESADYDHIQQWTRFEIDAWRSIPANGEFQIGENNNTQEGESITNNINN